MNHPIRSVSVANTKPNTGETEMTKRAFAGGIRPRETMAQVEARISIATIEAIDLAKAQINDGGMDDANAIDAACEQFPSAHRMRVADAIAKWK